jgi:hypothetical protein
MRGRWLIGPCGSRCRACSRETAPSSSAHGRQSPVIPQQYAACGTAKSLRSADDKCDRGQDHPPMIRTRALALCLAGAIVAVVAVAVAVAGFGTGSKADAQAPAVGQPPPEWAANAGAWPAHNHDLSNTRATTQSPINSQTVSKLKVKWRFPFKGAGTFGVFSSTPISLNGTVFPGPELERLRAGPLDRQGQVGARVQPAERRPERRRLRQRPPLRRHRDERLRAGPADREVAVDQPEADPQRQ